MLHADSTCCVKLSGLRGRSLDHHLSCSLRGHYPTGSKGQRRVAITGRGALSQPACPPAPLVFRSRREDRTVCPGPPASRAVTCRRMHHGSATGRARSATALLAALIALLALVPAAPAAAKATFKPRIHHAMGIIPARGSAPSPPPSNGIPV